MHCQSQSGPLNYLTDQRPNITTSLVDRIGIASAGLEKTISQLGPDAQFDGQSLGYAGQLYSQMAEFDIATNQTKYADSLTKYFLLAPHRSTNFSDIFAYGHAGAIAYKAYNDPVFLGYAVQSWWFGQNYTLSPEQVAAGKSPVKNFTIIKECQDITMAGGTFYASRFLPSTTNASNSLTAQSTDPGQATVATLSTG
ncbi:hypothetical protein B0H19DRAFT_932059 [Mycena capillaripes]|nr:hypothetical protein B0H19DRAFT_932059 [Mycena capillaripes]